MSNIKIYPIYANLVDIFQGEGWEHWTRIRKIKGKWEVIRGLTLSEAFLKTVTKEL